MAAEAEATREARAKVIAAEGEMKASRALKEASIIISESPSAMQVRINSSFHNGIVIYMQSIFSFAIFKHLAVFQQRRIQQSYSLFRWNCLHRF